MAKWGPFLLFLCERERGVIRYKIVSKVTQIRLLFRFTGIRDKLNYEFDSEERQGITRRRRQASPGGL